MARAKVRIRFQKTGDLRFVSHHDLLRCFERMLRRAGLPFASTEGFNPHPRLVFASALALGVAGLDELVDVELRDDVPPQEVHTLLARQAPPGLHLLGVRAVGLRSALQVRSATYRLALPPERHSSLTDRAAAFLAAPECWAERTHPQPRRINVRPFVAGLRLPPGAVEMDLLVTPHGTARAEEVLRALGLDDVLREGAVLERTRLELQEENLT
jgi:radical SAM-linked protein